MNQKAIFITGTDTDIGKTYVSRLLADTFDAMGIKTSYMKPVQTGCEYNQHGQLSAPDADYVFKGAAVQNKEYKCHVPYMFEPACSPHLAAHQRSITISFKKIKDCLNEISSDSNLVLVEGAGGLLAPLSETSFMLDLITYLNLPVILVTSPRLGTLNHTLLTLRALNQIGLQTAGVVVNNFDNTPRDFIYNDNINMITKFFCKIPVAQLPFGSQQNELKEFCNVITQTI